MAGTTTQRAARLRALDLDRRLDQAWERSAQRVHDRLIADPSSFSRPPSARLLLPFAILVIVGFVAVFVGLVWLALANDLWWRWPLILMTGLVAWAVVDPLGRRLAKDALVLDPADHAGLYAYIKELAAAMQVSPPEAIVIDLNLNAAVTSLRRGRRTLILGLPAWALWHPEERAAVLGHELGHLRGGDTGRKRIVDLSLALLSRAVYLLGPDPTAPWVGTPFGVAMHSVQLVLSAPFAILRFLMLALWMPAQQHQEYLADRRAIAIVGSLPLQTALAGISTGLTTELHAAVRRGEDPFTWLSDRPRPSAEALESYRRYLLAHPDHSRWNTHPPDHLRLSVLANTPTPDRLPPLDPTVIARAEDDMNRLIDTHRARYLDSIKRSWYR